jgi:cardiolipin synthase
MAPTSPRYHLHTISYRNHRKITVIDGEIGYTGGMNIGQDHLDGGEGFDYWRDTQVRLVGESVAILQAVFMVDWYNAVGENLFQAAYFPTATEERVENNIPVQILTSGPDSQWAAIRQVYALMVISARRHVYLQSPFFLPDATLAEALAEAALSGVDVKVMVSARPSGNRLPDWAGNTYIEDIVNAGVRVFFNAVFYSEQIAKQLEADFERDLADCTEFNPEEYRNRGTVARFRDSVARLLSPLL